MNLRKANGFFGCCVNNAIAKFRPFLSEMATRVSGEQLYEQPKWTPFLTKLLADLLVDQVLKGKRVNNSLPNKVWNFISNEFYKTSGLKWNKDHLKTRLAVLRRQYAVVDLLLSRNDYVFDESTGSVIATDEAWNQCVKEYPDAEDIRTSVCPIYKQLWQIFSEDSMTNGKHDTLHPNFNYVKETRTECSSEFDDDDPAVCPPTPKRRRRGVETSIAYAIFEMAAASKLRTATLEELGSRYSLFECIRELDRIPGLAENEYFAALELFNNSNARETFLSLKSNMRLPWLRWKCNAASRAERYL